MPIRSGQNLHFFIVHLSILNKIINADFDLLMLILNKTCNVYCFLFVFFLRGEDCYIFV